MRALAVSRGRLLLCLVGGLGLAAALSLAYRQVDVAESRERPGKSAGACRIGVHVQRRLGPTSEETFLHKIGEEMTARFADTGMYPSTWEELLSGDTLWRRWPIDVPRASARWSAFARPSKKAALEKWFRQTPDYLWYHTFVIEHASDTDYLIRAIDQKGRATWQMRAAVTKPEPLAPMLCHVEDGPVNNCGKRPNDELDVDRSVDASADEAPKFLADARWLMREFYWYRDKLPETWGELRMHWSLEEHFEGDDSARAPADTGRAWQPRGSRYTYLNESAGCTIRIRSTNTLGLPNYIVEGTSAWPREYTDE